MKFQQLIPFLLCFLLLSSCQSGKAENDRLYEALRTISSAEYTANITASFPEREAGFTISYSHSSEKDRATVLAPSEVKGVSYTVSDSGASLEFDDAILEIGKLDESNISPFSCLRLLLNIWKTEEAAELDRTVMHGKNAFLAIWKEENQGKEVEYRTWFSEDEFLPLYAEVFSDGSRIIQCTFERSIHNK